MSKLTYNYAAVVQQHKQQRGLSRVTAAQVVDENKEHWAGFAAAGATLDLAVSEITAPYLKYDVNPATVEREFSRIHGGWKKFCKGLAPKPAGTPIPSHAPLMPANVSGMPVLNDHRPTGGIKFGGQA